MHFIHSPRQATLLLQRIKNPQLKSIANYQLKSKSTFVNVFPKYNSLTHVNKSFIVNVPISSMYHQVQLPIKVQDVLNMLVKQNKLDQKCVILEHLSDILIDDPRICLTHQQREVLDEQISMWKGRSGRFEKIATVAWVIKRLNLLQKHNELYLQIVERMSNDEWYVNFDESIKALQAFVDVSDLSMKDLIYPRIERNITITVWEQNMIYYQRIAHGLLQAGRLASPLWDKIETHILANLGMEYTLTTITSIFTSFALSKNGSHIFYQQIQKAIYLGHWYKHSIYRQVLLGYQQEGEFYALMVEAYSLAKQNTQIMILPDFSQYIYHGISNRQTNYNRLSSFTKIIQHLPGLYELQDQQHILQNLLEKKRPNNIIYQEVIQFYDLMNQKGKTIPTALQHHIQQRVIADFQSGIFSPAQMILICEELLAKKYLLDVNTFIEMVQNEISRKFKYLEGKEAKLVMKLSQQSKCLPIKMKELLQLPFKQ